MKEDESEKKSRRALTIVEFLIFAGVSCAVPFLSVHMRSLGLSTVQEVMVVHAVSGFFVCFLVPMLMAFSVDLTFDTLKRQFQFYRTSETERHQQHRRRATITTTSGGRSLSKWCLCGCLVISSICCSTLLAVPKVVRMPRQALLDFDCYFFSSSSKEHEVKSAALRLEKCANWESCKDAAMSFGSDALFRISHCRQKCNRNNTSSETSMPSHVLHICFGPMHSAESTVVSDIKKERLLCLAHDPRLDSEEGSSHLEFRADLSRWRFSEFQNVSVTEFLKMDPRAPSYTINVCAFGPTILSSVTSALQVHEQPRGSITCGQMPYATSRDCTIRCLLTLQSEAPIHRLSYKRSNSCQEIIGNPKQTFWAYLGLRSLADVSIVSIICLLNGFNFFHHPWWVKPYSPQHDRSRTWSILAFAIFPPLLGILVDIFGNYSPAFVVSAGFQMIAMAVAVAQPLPGCGPSATYVIHSSSSSSINDDGIYPQQFWWSWSEACFILSMALIFGMLWSFAQVFSAWLYQDLAGFEHWTLGLCEAMCFMCFFPLLMVSSSLLREVGESYLCAAAFVFHALRHVGLSLVSSYAESKYGWWWPLPLEAMKAVALPFGWIALCARGERALAHEHPGQKRLVVLHSLLAVTYFGAGRIVGVCVGGALSNRYGFPTTFVSAAILALISALTLILSHFGHFRPQHRNRQAKLRTRQVKRALAMHGSTIELWGPEDQWPTIDGPESPFNGPQESLDFSTEGEQSFENL